MAEPLAADIQKRRLSISAPNINQSSPSKKRKASEAVQYTPDDTVVRWDQDDEQQNSALQLAWDQKMQEGTQYTSTKCYKEVHVLMISWDESSDDLKVQKEVDALADVFRGTYNFAVHPVSLRNNTNKLPRHQIHKHVVNFVYDYDSPRSLLIIYFAGHGTPGPIGGQLELHGNVDQFRAHRNKIIWNHTEVALRGTEGDVLQIFDCCYAGEMAHRGFGTRLYEYMAASSASETPAPGKKSFTCALIWALKKLSKDGRFTSSDLLRTIEHAPHFPRDQHPILSKPDGVHKEYIVLEPLSKGGSRSSPYPMLPASESDHSPPQDILTLRIIFENRPTVEMIEALGERTNDTVAHLSTSMDDFQVNRIMWGGLQSWSRDHRSWRRDPFVLAANQFLKLRRSPRPDIYVAPPERDAMEDSCT